jgi:predicted transcriptional regulator
LSTKLEKLLALLSDNVWHNIDEMAKTLEIPQDKLQQTIKFLTETDIIQHNQATNQIKLDQNWKTLIINQKQTNPETQTQPEQTAVGTIIIPPQKTLIIQCTRITNLTDNSLELEIRINKKINEIAINKIK